MARKIDFYLTRILRGPIWDNGQDHVTKVADAMDTIIILLLLAYCATYLVEHRWL